MHADPEQFIEEIGKTFPDQKEGVRNFLYTCKKIKEDAEKLGISGNPTIIQKLKVMVKYPTIMKFARKKYSQMLDYFISHEEVKRMFYLYCSWFGQAPYELSAAAGAVLTAIGQFDGIYYPKGGTMQFSKKLSKYYEMCGGKLRLNSTVRKINVENRTAIGIELDDGSSINGTFIISNADLKRTMLDYVGAAHLNESFINYIKNLKQSPSGISLFLGVNKDLSQYPAHMTTGRKADDIPKVRDQNIFELDTIVLRILTRIDPTINPPNLNSIVIYYMAPYNSNNKWKTGPNEERTEEYVKLKDKICEDIISMAERLIPNLRKDIKIKELATPITYSKYSFSTEGAWHGPSMINKKLPHFKTPIKNLLLAGGNMVGGGVPRVMQSGFKTADYILNNI